MTDIEAEFEEALARAPAQASQALRQLDQELLAQRIFISSRPVVTSLKPHFVPHPTAQKWGQSAEQLIALVNRIGLKVLREPALYDELGLTRAGRSLIEVDPGYAQMAVLCRPDGVYQGDQLRLLELNADCPAGAARNDRLQELVVSLFPLTELAQRWEFSPPQRTSGLFAALTAAYREWGGRKASPRIAIVSWQEDKNPDDRRFAAEVFERLGCPTLLVDPWELSLQDGKLYARGEPIDLVYRRVMLHMFLTHPDALSVLRRAYQDQVVCMVPPLRAEVATSKSLLALLHRADFQAAFLTAEERCLVAELIPYSCLVAPETRAQLLAERETWVLKPGSGFAGLGVRFGSEVAAATWQEQVDQIIARSEVWVAQKRVPTPTYRIVESGQDQVVFRELNVTWGPWIQGGHFSGITVRGASGLCVNVASGGASIIGLAYRRVGADPGNCRKR